jgi:hypothetical protein
MASAEDIYRVTLQELAAEGNEKAKLALAMAQKIGGTDTTQLKSIVCRELRHANENLLSALDANDSSWTKRTDRRINDAQNNIMHALEAMTK